MLTVLKSNCKVEPSVASVDLRILLKAFQQCSHLGSSRESGRYANLKDASLKKACCEYIPNAGDKSARESRENQLKGSDCTFTELVEGVQQNRKKDSF